MNGMRRDLTDMQRGAIRLLVNKASDLWAEQQDRQRKEIELERKKKISDATKGNDRAAKGRPEKTDVVHREPHLFSDPTPETDPHKGRLSRAKDASISPSTQARVESLANNRPDLLEKVASGAIKGAEALRVMKKDAVAGKAAALPDGKFTVIYADPPWAYNDKQGGDISQSYGAAEKHYPSMSLFELETMGVPGLAADDSVLFLWATCPLLPEALRLAAAWGFKYKAQFVWDKIKHNMGHYNSVRHEILLICTRGSFTPENVKLFDSVQSIERTEHSRKPEEFRTIIETLYPSAKKIELFARKKADGWESWGNETDGPS